jgi:hypothetical protein
MSSATTADSRPTVPASAGPMPPAGRRAPAEVWVAALGLVLSTVFLGGFAVVMNRLDAGAFAAELYPEMQRAGLDLAAGGGPGDAYQAARTLAAWFGLTLMVVLGLGAVGILAARHGGGFRTPVWVFAAAGLACLLGSQLILYPVAFLFFVAAGLSAVRRARRRPDAGSTR